MFDSLKKENIFYFNVQTGSVAHLRALITVCCFSRVKAAGT
jgi:hypothetical protein